MSLRGLFRALAAGGLSAAVALTGRCAEPDYSGGNETAAVAPSEAESSALTSQARVLRWKTSRITSSSAEAARSGITTTVITASHEETAPSEKPSSTGLRPAFKTPAKPGSWNKSKAGSPSNLLSDDGAIRLVAHDPKSDPFGDRVTQAGREPALAPPEGTRRAALNDQPEAAPAPDAAEPKIKAPANLKPAEDLPMPMEKAEPMEKSEPKEESLRPVPEAKPAVDTYNYRDCSKAEEGCKLFAESIRGVPLSHISLNIMPHYMPDAKTREEDEKERKKQLESSTARDWRDRAGKVLATGRLIDLRNSKVIVGDETGAEVASLNVYDLSDNDMCFLTAWWRLPGECQSQNAGYLPHSRDWMPSTFTWTASALCHKPLYFEEVQLERYGHTAGPIKQPIISGAHFFLNIAALPYKMAINPPRECQYPLGYYRPGDCAPWQIPPIPLSLRGAAAEAGVWVGGIFMIP
ncbi:MAG: hypothetical protein K8R36_01745 [Planctomycetales bacterium]|nr:hypothetical protein [Planctomycetales bacterium]